MSVGGDGLFHIDAQQHLTAMVVTPYEAEDVLQGLLVSHPDLLAGGQMTPASPRRWALVQREHSVPDRADGAGRWSIDHLFVDQDAVPTLVEVKRSTDTRIRREVVGQMLDYAANGVRYWPIEQLRVAFETTQNAANRDPVTVISELTAGSSSVDEFFESVEDNLRAGRIRMVFVADVIPDELRRITEFLNEQMDPAEVFAVEVKQYRADGYDGTVIVPAVFGRTAAASAKSVSHTPIDRQAMIDAAAPSSRTVMELLTELAENSSVIDLSETPAALRVVVGGRQVVVQHYITANFLEVPLGPVRDAGYNQEADTALGDMVTLVNDGRGLTRRTPWLSGGEVVSGWPTLSTLILDLAELHTRM